MTIEIIKGTDNNPVAEFFSSSSTPETNALTSVGLENADRECVPAEFARKLECERNDAREKIERQANRIRYLEGATNYAKGTPLSIALRERDEALSQIVQAECRAERFCQERDEARNAIIGWENKWKCAVDMAARAELERDDALNKLNDLKDILR